MYGWKKTGVRGLQEQRDWTPPPLSEPLSLSPTLSLSLSLFLSPFLTLTATGMKTSMNGMRIKTEKGTMRRMSVHVRRSCFLSRRVMLCPERIFTKIDDAVLISAPRSFVPAQ
jgi:hypothetical protein